MRKNQDGFIEVIGGLLVLLIVVSIFLSAIFVRFQASTDVVSGIVYNTKTDTFPKGNTNFSVRAAVDTYVTEENESSYCLPKGSPYLAIINKAAADKSIKVVVTANKYFAIQTPFTCNPNITVTEAK